MKKIISKIRNPKVLRVIFITILVALLTGGYIFYEKFHDRVNIDNSQIMAPIINISATGKLTELDAIEGHTVREGDVLAVVGGNTLRAQTDGLIVAASDEVGGVVSQTAPLVQMIRPEDMRVVGTLDENKGLDIIHVGQPISFTVDALPGQTFWGYVDEVSPTAKTTQAAFSISSERPTQQFEVFARFNSRSYPGIKNGMSAKMVVYTK